MCDARRSMLLPLLLILALAGCGGDDTDGEARTATGDAPATTAAGGGDLSAEEEELADYRLEIDEVRKWAALTASPEFAALSEELEASEGGGADVEGEEAGFEEEDTGYDEEGMDGDDDSPSLDQIEAQLEAHPRARALIEGAGLDVRDFLLIGFTMLQLGLVQYAMDQGLDADSLAVENNLNPENVDFLREHGAELAAMRNGSAAADGQ